MVPSSAQYRLIDLQMEGEFAHRLITDRGDMRLSFEEISRRLFAERGIEVSGQTLRNWHRLLVGEAKAAS